LTITLEGSSVSVSFALLLQATRNVNGIAKKRFHAFMRQR
jgi:hypothetical protein